jgi:nucleotide-binding universal stress UspA family protein
MAGKTLVVPLDGSAYAELALPMAEALADRIGGGLLLVSAQYQGPLDPREYLEECATNIQHPVETIATKDELAADVIIKAIEESDDRIVCMTTHGRGRVRWAVLGSVAEEVIRRANRPMFLVGRNCRSDFLERSAQFLACTDGSYESEELAPAAREWSEILGLELRVAMVAHPLDVESAETSDTLLRSLAAEFGDPDRIKATMVRRRFVAGALADLADELPAAVIGLNCHARSGLARFALGSVTMGVLQFAPCPLLVTHRLPHGDGSSARDPA